MTSPEIRRFLNLASEYLESAMTNAEEATFRPNVAYDEARHTAELAGKVLLQHKHQQYPRKHSIAGHLAQHGLIPINVDPRALHRFLEHHTRAAYGYLDPVDQDDLNEALQIAHAMLEAAHNWPTGAYHEPPTENLP